MSRDVLSRYEQDADGVILIDITAERAADLFEEFDRRAPYIKRDLDQDLVDYLIEAAEEIRTHPFRFCFSLEENPGDRERERVRKGVTSFFLALTAIEARKVHQMWRRSGVLVGLGLSLMALSVWVNQRIGSEPGVFSHVLAEGLTVASWMSVWESLAGIAIDWLPLRGKVKLYRRMATTPIAFLPPKTTREAQG